jgi:transketolase
MLNKSLNLSEEIFAKQIISIPIRDGFGEGLVTAGEVNDTVVVLTADLKDSTRASKFAEMFPNRFIECGVSEQSMVTVASGMANYGKIPFICSFAAFNPGRTWEQIRTTVCINDVPVKIGGLFVGVSVGPDGATHQMLEDIALMRAPFLCCKNGSVSTE